MNQVRCLVSHVLVAQPDQTLSSTGGLAAAVVVDGLAVVVVDVVGAAVVDGGAAVVVGGAAFVGVGVADGDELQAERRNELTIRIATRIKNNFFIFEASSIITIIYIYFYRF